MYVQVCPYIVFIVHYAVLYIQVPEEELKLSDGLEKMWLDLFKEAKMVDRSLVTVKEKFTIGSSTTLLYVMITSLPLLCR